MTQDRCDGNRAEGDEDSDGVGSKKRQSPSSYCLGTVHPSKYFWYLLCLFVFCACSNSYWISGNKRSNECFLNDLSLPDFDDESDDSDGPGNILISANFIFSSLSIQRTFCH